MAFLDPADAIERLFRDCRTPLPQDEQSKTLRRSGAVAAGRVICLPCLTDPTCDDLLVDSEDVHNAMPTMGIKHDAMPTMGIKKLTELRQHLRTTSQGEIQMVFVPDGKGGGWHEPPIAIAPTPAR